MSAYTTPIELKAKAAKVAAEKKMLLEQRDQAIIAVEFGTLGTDFYIMHPDKVDDFIRTKEAQNSSFHAYVDDVIER